MTDLNRPSGWCDSEVTGNPNTSLTFSIDDGKEKWIIQLGHVTQPGVELGIVLKWALRLGKSSCGLSESSAYASNSGRASRSASRRSSRQYRPIIGSAGGLTGGIQSPRENPIG